ncbi:FecR family protein [Kriegella aquimaris]|uniref:FecR family protein n=1 Tax=Kriegella aquimaris TaxID=192904 RepID=A0A1G9WVN5_9FLAO|nr:FecR domain-containing protein [Kriegella aquimaris]SDM88341.1 FecR family protein [Kriegella aquimaris]
MDIAKIIAKKLNGSLSDQEQGYLDQWLKESEENKSLYLRLKESGNLKDITSITDIDENKQWQEVRDRVKKAKFKTRSIFRFRSVIKYAAICIGVIGLGYGYQYFDFFVQEPVESEDVITLKLENGEVRTISSESHENIIDSKGRVLGKQIGNQINYSDHAESKELVYNTLSVPYGKRFSVILSDSTIVHLNAGSSLKYPVNFIEHHNRQVFLIGEGYFDVAKDSAHPFVVTNGTMDVRVLGTKFNISAYPEDRDISTVLVEGSVSLYNSEDVYDPKKANVLQPGYKAAWDKFHEKIELEEVDTDIYTGWVNGKLVLKEMSFKNIIPKLERHYKVTIDNNYEALNNEVFTATFDVETIDEALKIFSVETPFEYKFENNAILINELNIY